MEINECKFQELQQQHQILANLVTEFLQFLLIYRYNHIILFKVITQILKGYYIFILFNTQASLIRRVTSKLMSILCNQC